MNLSATKKFIGCSHPGSYTSGTPKTLLEVRAWAKQMLGQHKNINTVFITEAVETCQRTEPPVVFIGFTAESATNGHDSHTADTEELPSQF